MGKISHLSCIYKFPVNTTVTNRTVPPRASITLEIMAATRFISNLRYPRKLFIHFITLLPTFCLCLASFHSSSDSSTPLSKINGNLDLASLVETGISSNMIHTQLSKQGKQPQNLTVPEVSAGEKCDIFTGSWVHDLSYPLYDWRECPYIEGQFNCQKNKRPDSDYEKWRWKPRDCNISRFNALNLLQRLRGMTILFVGDSLTNNQWQSMLCLLSSVLPLGRTTFIAGHPVSTFKALDYGVSVLFQWAPYLVDTVSKVIGGQQKVVLQLDSIELNSRTWTGADILICESGHWWGHTSRAERKWDYIEEGGHYYEDMDRMVAYRKALTTWGNWIDSNIDINRTRVFYRSFSGAHSSASDWKSPAGLNCYNETKPVLGSSYPGPYPPQLQIAEDVLSGMTLRVSFLNITTLSLLRKDGHPSIYSTNVTAEERKNPELYADCSHWCLPGIPDTWNELLYSALFIS